MGFLAAGCNNTNQAPIKPTSAINIVIIGQNKINVEIASTESARNKGLSDRDSLGENDGMLFVFDQPGKYSFWMKDMRFALDLIWINDNKVVEITPNVLHEPNVPAKSLKMYTPQVLIDSVLEVNTGWAAKNGIKIGDSLNLTVK